MPWREFYYNGLLICSPQKTLLVCSVLESVPRYSQVREKKNKNKKQKKTKTNKQINKQIKKQASKNDSCTTK